MEKTTHPSALWTFISTAALVAVGASLLNGFSTFFSQFGLLFAAPWTLDNSGSPVGTVLACSLVSVVVSIVSGLLVNYWLGNNSGKHAVMEMLDGMQNQYNFFNFFVLVLIEEIAARWLCLGVLPKHLNSHPFVFYCLLFGGNLLWSLIHLLNFQKPEDRHFARVLPQFLAGLIFSFIYLKYGLLASILVHFADNSLLLTFHKIEDAMPDKDFWIGGYSLVICLLSVAYLNYIRDHSPWDMGVWLERDSDFAIDGWNFFDYLPGSLAIGYGLRMISIFFCYDQGQVKEDGESLELPNFLQIIVCLAALVFLVMVGYWLMGVFSSNVHCRALLLTILLCFFVRSSSGSGMARNFWIMLPDFYIGICILEALGFILAVALLGLHLVTAIPVLCLQRRNV